MQDTSLNQIPLQGPLGIQVTPVAPTGQMISPAGHLTTLYGTNEEYIAACHPVECISSPETSNQQSKKRKISGANKSSNQSIHNGSGMVHIKQEPSNGLSPEPNSSNSNVHTTSIPNGDEEYFDYGPDGQIYLDSVYQCIRFQPFQQTNWYILCDSTFKEL